MIRHLRDRSVAPHLAWNGIQCYPVAVRGHIGKPSCKVMGALRQIANDIVPSDIRGVFRPGVYHVIGVLLPVLSPLILGESSSKRLRAFGEAYPHPVRTSGLVVGVRIDHENWLWNRETHTAVGIFFHIALKIPVGQD